ncbi:MAG TPA: DUF1778 domain-containing protein [Rhizomicrobium sp.]|nr:DUF1778 domain-containing protein [Rhizomicrobium sp.]
MTLAAKPKGRQAASIARPKPDTTINVRVSSMVKDLIDNAASVLGKTRTDFIVESARSHAIDVLLDQRFFSLEARQYDAFLKALDRPAVPSRRLKRLMQTNAPWDKS